MTRALACIVVLAGIATLAACGVGADDYRAAVHDVQVRHEARLTALTTKATADLAGRMDAAVVDLGALAQEIAAFAAEVKRVPTPEADQTAADALVAAYTRLRAATLAVRAAVIARNRTALAAALVAFNAAADGEAAAVDAFNGT